jgi:hypothetical protein
MMDRCYLLTNKDYPNIGGKGIIVCPEWHEYSQFFMDMGEKIAEYRGVKAAALATGLKQGTISKCLSGGNDTAGGFRWEYREP